MPITVFYSWQSDTPARVNRSFIEDALTQALNEINADAEVVKPDRSEGVVLDKDTKGLPGTPPIVEAIFRKIDQCAVFVPDLTFVAKTSDGRLQPNANVLIEYGWALRSRSHERIVPVMNDAFGEPSETNLPFNMRHLRWQLRYTLPNSSDADRSSVRSKLAAELARAIRTVLASAPRPKFQENVLTYARGPRLLRPRSVFFERGETLATRESRNFSVPEGPKMFLRLGPTAPMEHISPTKAYRMAMQGSLTPFRTARESGGRLYDRNQYGAIAYDLREGKIEELSQLLESSELWGISCRLQELRYVPVGFEHAFTHVLEQYLAFSQVQLKLQLPVRLIAGSQT